MITTPSNIQFVIDTLQAILNKEIHPAPCPKCKAMNNAEVVYFSVGEHCDSLTLHIKYICCDRFLRMGVDLPDNRHEETTIRN
jgi:hypothetical protein